MIEDDKLNCLVCTLPRMVSLLEFILQVSKILLVGYRQHNVLYHVSAVASETFSMLSQAYCTSTLYLFQVSLG